MIDTKELRLGNLVYKRYWEATNIYSDLPMEICLVNEIKNDKLDAYCGSVGVMLLKNKEIVYKVSISNIYDIPLTEEWLLKLGFEKKRVKGFDDEYGQWWCGVKFTLRFLFEYDDRLGSFSYGPSGCLVKSVHQLQNLYYALTGEELECK